MTHPAPAALLMVAESEHDADMYYASRFVAGDPFIYFNVRGRSALVMSDLELGRAKLQSGVDDVISYAEVVRTLRKDQPDRRVGQADVITELLRKRGVKSLRTPSRFPLGMAEQLRKRGLEVVPAEGLVFPDRAVKTKRELAAIEAVQRATEEAVEIAIESLRRSKARGSKLFFKGEIVTSESLKRIVHRALMDRECTASRTIIAGGDQGCDPHHTGTGPIAPNRTIVFDVFPRSATTLYFADMSRTVVKGKASKEVHRMYDAVKEAQEEGIRRVKAGADGLRIHEQVKAVLDGRGFKTEKRKGKMVGYFHGTGHGVGLDIHEAPWITPGGTRIPAGAVVTVEPGLYYPGVGAVRLEDMVHVTRTGCRNLTRFPKVLEV